MQGRIVKESLRPLKHIVIILIGFSTQAETNAFLPIVFHSLENLEINKRDRASQSGPIVAHTVTCRVCWKVLLTDLTLGCKEFHESITVFSYSKNFFLRLDFWILDPPSGKSGGQWVGVVTSAWRGQSWIDVQGGDEASGKQKELLRSKQMAFELKPGFWQKLYSLPSLKVLRHQLWQKIIQDVWNHVWTNASGFVFPNLYGHALLCLICLVSSTASFC